MRQLSIRCFSSGEEFDYSTYDSLISRIHYYIIIIAVDINIRRRTIDMRIGERWETIVL